jgi:hypothetical protein
MANPVSIPVRVEQIRRDPDRCEGHFPECVHLRVAAGKGTPMDVWACVDGCPGKRVERDPIPGVGFTFSPGPKYDELVRFAQEDDQC